MLYLSLLIMHAGTHIVIMLSSMNSSVLLMLESTFSSRVIDAWNSLSKKAIVYIRLRSRSCATTWWTSSSIHRAVNSVLLPVDNRFGVHFFRIVYFCSLYDTRCYFKVRSKADMSQLNLPNGNNN